MVSDPPKVLVSYSHDSTEHEKRVLALVKELRTQGGVDAWIDLFQSDPDQGWISWMREQIERADRVLLVFTETYARRFLGKETPGKGLGATFEGVIISQALYESGIHNAKFRPVVFCEEDEVYIPLDLRRVNRYRVGTPESYEKLLKWLHGEAEHEVPPVGPKPELLSPRGRLHGVPDLPPHYLAREADLAELKQKLLAGFASLGVTGQSSSLGVQGMGGIGKTVLAAAVAHDLDIRQTFPDGVYWLTIGQKANLLDLQIRLLRQLGEPQEALATESEGKDVLREKLKRRRTLIVLDDAWTIEHVDAFSVTAPPARLLVTTRNQEVLVALGAEEHRVGLLSPSDALKMLTEWVGEKSPDQLPLEATQVAEECGYLPLALAMIGAMIRLRPTAWKDALGRLQSADLEAVKRNFPGYPYPNLLRAIEVSVEGLISADRERYLDLAVFPEDQPIPEEPLRVLWNLTGVDTRDCMTRLVARSLGRWAPGETSLLLHDLQHDLIHKRREENLPSLHLRLVESWDSLPKLDSYTWRQLAYHLVQARRKNDLRRLLVNFDYLEAKLAATDPNALISDYDSIADENDLRLIQSAIRLSANVLARDTRQLPGQLTGRLLSNPSPTIQALLKRAAGRSVWPWLRPLKPSLCAPGGSLIRTFEGHSDIVRAVVVTPDGRRALSASDDGTLRLWDLRSGLTIRTLEGHTISVLGVAVTPDGRRAVSGSADRTLRLWDLESGLTVRTLEGHTDIVWAVAVTPDGLHGVSASYDGTLRLWDLERGLTIQTLEGHAGGVRAVAVSPDGRRAISASADRALRLWDLGSGLTIRTLKGHTASISSVAITLDGRRAVSASGDRTLRLWDLETGKTLRTLDGHSHGVCAVAVTPDGHRAVSASDDGTLRLWDLETCQTLHLLDAHSDGVCAVAVTPDGHRALSASEDQTLRLWDLESELSIHKLEDRKRSGSAVGVTSDGRRAVTASGNRSLRLWDLERGETVRTLESRTSGIRALAITPDGHQVILASRDLTIRILNLETGQTVRTLKGHTSNVRSLAVTPDGRRVVSASEDRTLRVWDLKTGLTIRPLEGHTRSVSAVAITPDGRRAISASYDETLRLWHLESGETLLTLKGHTDIVSAVAITPDGRGAVSASGDRTLRLWDLQTGETLRKLEGHMSGILAVAITPDGHGALSTSDDQTLRLWDLETAKVVATFTGESGLDSCAITPDGQTIIAGDLSGQVHLLLLVKADEMTSAIGETKIPLLQRTEQGWTRD
jgi:WD40 repeat protein